MPEYRRSANDHVWSRLNGNPTCERVECEREAIYVAYTYGQRQKLCPFHAYAAPSRRPIYPKDRD